MLLLLLFVIIDFFLKFVVMGVEKEVLRAGTGPKPRVGQTVEVHCTGFG